MLSWLDYMLLYFAALYESACLEEEMLNVTNLFVFPKSTQLFRLVWAFLFLESGAHFDCEWGA